MERTYQEAAPSRADIDALAGPALLEFGTNWCGYCRAAQAPLAEAYADYPAIRHFKVEDGPGRLLGRSFRVKLWPTMIFLQDGKEVARVVRPESAAEIRDAFAQIAPPG
ncbi:thioredoxin family protein [Pseudoduganella sp. SL102]|uniref:Thioredoxin n=1 Tax=Pseudoduganella albidiflava TaxID=321983 RepID=A0A411WT73_9BURK|nr:MULTISPECIES: thioredoxin family protein [Pseudoduganella]QBH99841.1 thioredoxin [Pseudoduganella albidiflava]WBS02158.1 thioredoxin family protein [Pseudoduganella sp. SL102]GGY54340.1 thiol reductase thioredoxin [Pseudoduganella albidiflava]